MTGRTAPSIKNVLYQLAWAYPACNGMILYKGKKTAFTDRGQIYVRT